MPPGVLIGLMVLGGVLLLVSIIGGRFKIFGAEVSDTISSWQLRLLAGVLGVIFVLVTIFQSLPKPPDSPASSSQGGPSVGQAAQTSPTKTDRAHDDVPTIGEMDKKAEGAGDKFDFDDYLARARIKYAHAAVPEASKRGEVGGAKNSNTQRGLASWGLQGIHRVGATYKEF
jgi:hypothetical protein